MKKIKNIIFMFILIFALVFGLFLLNGWYIEFSEGNSENLTIEYGEEIKVEPLSAYFKGKYLFKDGKSLDVITTHNINPNKIGSYEIKHNASFLFWDKETITSLNIVDTKSPKITLKTIENYYTIPGKEYKEEGFSAYDNYDGDITNKVISYIKDGIVYYIVEDSSGNKTTETREIIYKDTIPPNLTLLGENVIFLAINENFVDPGCYAIDNCDGDITNKINIETNLNINEIGLYEIKYTVRDHYNNLTTRIRKVVVQKEKGDESFSNEIKQFKEEEIIKANNEKTEKEPIDIKNSKVIYLTFDDGPSKYTQELLNILKKYDVKATFFVVNSSYKDMISKIYEDGHSIGIHSYTHEYKKIYANEKAYFEDFNKTKELIYAQTGYYTNLVRFPGGSSNSVSKQYNKGIITRLAKKLQEQGYQYFDWNVSSGDAGGAKTSEQVYKNVISGIGNKKTAIVLQHDTKKFSIDAVEDIIIWGKENDYIFLPLTIDSPASHHKIIN